MLLSYGVHQSEKKKHNINVLLILIVYTIIARLLMFVKTYVHQ